MTYQWFNGETQTPIVELRRYRLHPGQPAAPETIRLAPTAKSLLR